MIKKKDNNFFFFCFILSYDDVMAEEFFFARAIFGRSCSIQLVFLGDEEGVWVPVSEIQRQRWRCNIPRLGYPEGIITPAHANVETMKTGEYSFDDPKPNSNSVNPVE